MTCLFVVGYQKTDGADPIFCGESAIEVDAEPIVSFIKLIPETTEGDLFHVLAFHVTKRCQTYLCEKHFDQVEKATS